MPRAQVYITKDNLEKIKSIVIKERNDGADRNEANLSSVAAMLLDIGLQVYEFKHRNEHIDECDESENGSKAKQIVMFNKILMENVLKTSYASAIILQMIGELNEIKKINSFSFPDIKLKIRKKIDNKLNEIFDEK